MDEQNGDTQPKFERVLALYSGRECTPTHEEWKRALGALEQHEYNVYTPEEGADLQVVRRWLEGQIKASEADERECPFGAEEMSEFIDELRMCYPGWAVDEAISAACEVADKERAKHAKPLPVDRDEREKRTDAMSEFFGCFPANDGWRYDDGVWRKTGEAALAGVAPAPPLPWNPR